MTDSRLMGIVTALLFLATSQEGRAQITLEHLLVIDQYLSTNDTRSLYSYLEKNPELLLGEDELSVELRNFHNSASAGNLDYNYTSGWSANPDDAAVDNAFLH